jgi:hypothetical protein
MDVGQACVAALNADAQIALKPSATKVTNIPVSTPSISVWSHSVLVEAARQSFSQLVVQRVEQMFKSFIKRLDAFTGMKGLNLAPRLPPARGHKRHHRD